MPLPLNLVIDRTADGKLRAEVEGHPESAVEAFDLRGLLNAVQEAVLPLISTEPVGSGRGAHESATIDPIASTSEIGTESTDADDEALRRLARERMPDREALEKLVVRNTVPNHWPEGDEDWDDVP
jgi:hypothetical protein